MAEESTNTKNKYYLWRTKSNAGITVNDYNECQKNFNGKQGGRCVKKYTSKEEAEQELQLILNEIEQSKSDGEEARNLVNEEEQGDDQGDKGNKDQENEQGHDDRYEEFVNFKIEITDFMTKVEQQVTDLTAENRELFIEIKDVECQLKNKLNEVRMEFDRKVTDILDNFESQLKALRDENAKSNTRINKEIWKLNETDKKLEQSLLQSNQGDNSEIMQSYVTVDNTIIREKTRIGQQEENASSIIRSTPKTSTNLQNEDPFDATAEAARETSMTSSTEPILILSDSMLRGIIQRKFAPNRYTNKQYIQGGTAEMIEHLQTMEDPTNYEYVIIHTGTNDIGKKSTEDIKINYNKIIQEAKCKWGNAKIVMSGIIQHSSDKRKNEVSLEINNATQQMCEFTHNAIYIDNTLVTQNKDGSVDNNAYFDEIHLNNRTGTRKLVANLKDKLGLRRNYQQHQQPPRPSRENQRRTVWNNNRNDFQRYEETDPRPGWRDEPKRTYNNRNGFQRYDKTIPRPDWRDEQKRAQEGTQFNSIGQVLRLIANWLE